MDIFPDDDTQTQSTVDTEDDKNEKGDLRNVPKGILKQFIDVYRAHPALWQIKNKEVYNNRNLKNRGYLELVNIWKRFDPEANQKTVKLKIQSLRGSFRKELKKVEKSERSGKGVDEIYKSNLWYFNLMMFLIDHEVPAESIDNINIPLTSGKNTDSVQKPVDDLNGSNDNGETNEDEITGSVSSPIIIGRKRYEKIDENTNPQKKQKMTEERQRKMFMTKCTEALTAKETESEALAKYLSLKLEKVSNPEQKMYAKVLLTKVINRAILNRLTEATDLTDFNNHNSYTYPLSVQSSSSTTYTPLNSPPLITIPSQKLQDIGDGDTEITDTLRQFYADINKEI